MIDAGHTSMFGMIYGGCLALFSILAAKTGNLSAGTISALSGGVQNANKTLVFCETQDSSETVAEKFRENGVLTGVYHAGKSARENRETLESFQSRLPESQLNCLVSVHALDEGVDVANVDCGIMLASTKQKRQVIQRLGRTIRRKEDGGNVAIILVYANETSESPYYESASGESHLGMLFENAMEWVDYQLTELNSGLVEDFISETLGTRKKTTSAEQIRWKLLRLKLLRLIEQQKRQR